MELANNSTTPIITPEEPNSVTPNLTNSPVNPNATVTGSNKNTNIETISPCKCRSAILNINSSKNDILKVEAQLSALKSYVNCNLSILRNLWWPIVIMLIFIHKRYFWIEFESKDGLNFKNEINFELSVKVKIVAFWNEITF